MTPYPVLDDLGLVLIGAGVLLVIGRRLHLPPILSWMGAGLLLGPVTGLLGHSESLELFAELGVALLLFVVGLELSIEKLRAFGGTALLAGTGQVAVTFGLGAGVAHLVGFDPAAAIVTGLVAAFSSTAVVVKLLDRAGALEAPHGRLSIGILLVQDVLVVVVLTILGGLADSAGAGSTAGTAGALTDLGLALLGMAGIVLVGAALGRWVLPGVVRWMTPLPEGLFLLGLTWAFAFILAAESLHLSIELGAFIAGVILAQIPHTEELRRRTHPLVDFFLAVFFVTLGAGLDTASMAESWPAAVVVSIFVLTVKPALIALLLGLLGQGPRTSVLAGLTLGQISEFAFILAGLATAAGLVPPAFLGFTGLVGLITIGVSSVVVPLGPRLVGHLEGGRIFARFRGADTPPAHEPWADHVVVVGMNTLGRIVVARLRNSGERVLAIDTDPAKLDVVGGETMSGDVTRTAVIEEAGIPRARLVVSALQIEDVNNLLAWRCRRLGVPVAIHAFDPSMAEDLTELGVDHPMVSKLDGIRLVEEGLVRLGVFG